MTTIQSHAQKAAKSDEARRGAGRADPAGSASFADMLTIRQAGIRSEALRAQWRAQEARHTGAQRGTRQEKEAPEPEEKAAAQGSAAAQVPLPEPAGDEAALQNAAGLPGMPAFGAALAGAPGEGPDLLALAALLPNGEDDGVFEVTMPGSGKVGVSVSQSPGAVSYLLVPESEQLSARLHGHEMELEAWLRRRIRRNVRVAVV